jgi:opacity protein-like surface antigen
MSSSGKTMIAAVSVVCLVTLLPATVTAQPDQTQTATDDGWYLSFGAGPQWRQRASDSAGSTTFDTGFLGFGAVGHRFNDWRVEAEAAYFVNDCDTTDPTGPAIGVEPSSGDVDIDGLFVNAYYDFAIEDSRFTPYVGVGIGRHKVSINGLTTPSLSTLPPEWGGPVVVYADSTWTSAYQLKAGTSYRLDARTDLVLGYRYVKGGTLDINLADGSTIHPKAELHSLEVGVRVSF